MIYLAVLGPLAGIFIGYNVQRAIDRRRDRLWLEELRKPVVLDTTAPTVVELDDYRAEAAAEQVRRCADGRHCWHWHWHGQRHGDVCWGCGITRTYAESQARA